MLPDHPQLLLFIFQAQDILLDAGAQWSDGDKRFLRLRELQPTAREASCVQSLGVASRITF